MRGKVRQLLKMSCHVYPPSKMFQYLLDSLKSKNVRTRTECLEELGSLIERNGLSICTPSKAIPLIATNIADRDAGVRNASLNAVVQALYLQENLKGSLKLEDKYLSLLDERMRRSKMGKSPSKKGGSLESLKSQNSLINSSSSVIDLRSIPIQRVPEVIPEPEEPKNYSVSRGKPFSLGLESLDLPEISDASKADTSQMITHVPQTQYTAPTPMINDRLRGASLRSSMYVIDYLPIQISQNEPLAVIEALRQFTNHLNTQPEDVIRSIQPIVNALISKLNECFTRETPINVDPQDYVRLRKHVVNGLVQVFSSKKFAAAVPKETLNKILCELLDRLLDDRINQMESGGQLCRALNVLTSRILENSSRNDTFSILIDQLEKSTFRLYQERVESETSPVAKYAEMVMKCIWKITKMIKDSLEEMNVAELLYDIHVFLSKAPPSEWKKRTTSKIAFGDMPLKTVKTIIHELVLGLQDNVQSFLYKIDQPEKSYVWNYLHYMLENLKKKAHKEKEETVTDAPIVVDETLLNNQLTKIFKKIGTKDESQQVKKKEKCNINYKGSERTL